MIKLRLNTLVYEVAKGPIERTLESAREFGFAYIEYAAWALDVGQQPDLTR